MKQLYKLNPDEVSLVPRGANKKKFLVLKEDKGMDQKILDQIKKGDPTKLAAVEKVIKDHMDSMKKDEPTQPELSQEAQTALKAVARLLMPFQDELDPELIEEVMEAAGVQPPTAASPAEQPQNGNDMGDMSNVPDDHKQAAHKTASEAYKSAYKQEIEKLGKPGEAMNGGKPANKQEDGKDMSQPITKADGSLDLSAIPEAVRPTLELIYKNQQEAVAKAASLEKELKHEREQRVTKEFKEKAAQYKNLGNTDELATILKALADSAPEQVGKIEAIFKSADERIAQGSLLTERGSSLPKVGGGTSWEAIEKAAELHVSKSSEKISKADSVDYFLKTEEGRKLYNEYKNSRVGGA